MKKVVDTILQRDAQGTIELTFDAVELSQRIVWISEISMESAISFARRIRFLVTENSHPITVVISSSGGEVQAGLAMLDAITTCGVDVNTCCIGTAYSMGAILLASGKHRAILPNSSVMIHQPLINSCGGGNCDTIESLSKNLSQIKEKLNTILSHYSGKPIEELEKVTKGDFFMTAQEAVDFGLVDEVVSFEKLFLSKPI